MPLQPRGHWGTLRGAVAVGAGVSSSVVPAADLWPRTRSLRGGG